MEKLRFAILGAGCGGQSMAAILENQGCAVTLMDKNEALVQELKQEEKLTLTGKIELTAPMPACVTTDAAEAIDGADVILVVTTADGHEDVARTIAKTIRPEQIVVLNPGMFCGALAFRTALSRFGFPRVPKRQNSVFALVHRPIPQKLSKLSTGKKLAWSGFVRLLVFTHTKAQVLNSNPHPSITIFASNSLGHAPHIKSRLSSAAISRTGSAAISSSRMVR